jgi:hypothetical protein
LQCNDSRVYSLFAALILNPVLKTVEILY